MAACVIGKPSGVSQSPCEHPDTWRLHPDWPDLSQASERLQAVCLFQKMLAPENPFPILNKVSQLAHLRKLHLTLDSRKRRYVMEFEPLAQLGHLQDLTLQCCNRDDTHADAVILSNQQTLKTVHL